MFLGHNQARKLRYGLIYNGYAATNANIAPSGWRVPTYNDYLTLINYLGGASVAGGHMKSLKGWDSINADNSHGFSALGSGGRSSITYDFYFRKYWNLLITTSYSSENGLMLYWRITGDSISIESATIGGTLQESLREGYSIRLIKNDSSNPGILTDYDGNDYDCVTIGSQVWTKQNFKCTRLNNGTSISQLQDSSWASASAAAYSIYDNGTKNI